MTTQHKTTDIFDALDKNKFSYEDIRFKSHISLINSDEEFDVNVIIGFRGRESFLYPVIESFKRAFDFHKEKYGDKTFCITLVEHSNGAYVKKAMLEGKVDCYIWTPGNVSEQYNRSFAYNFGVKYSNKAKYYLLHDVDILVKDNFFEEVFKNLGQSKCMQTYGKRRVLYLSRDITPMVINEFGGASVNLLTENSDGVSLPMYNGQPALGSKGGSILVERDFYFKIGGFDPELFWGYAAEDQIFWDKATTLLGEVTYADNPPIDIFHMWHPPTSDTNPLLLEMEDYMLQFRRMNKKDRHRFITLKQDLIS